MKSGVMNKMKWFVVSALIVLLVGMTLLGVFGFNNTIDYSESYEISVSIALNDDDAKQILSSTSSKYLEDNDIDVVSVKKVDDGMTIIYQTNEDYTAKTTGLKDAVDTALSANPKTNGTHSTVACNIMYESDYTQPLKVILAFGIGLVAIFVYLLIMNKLASALAVICSSVLSVLVFVAVLAITRIPALPTFEFGAVGAGVIGAILSILTVSKYKEELKNAVNNKIDTKEIADKTAIGQAKLYLFFLIGALVAGVALMAFFLPYMLILGGQIIVASIVAVVCAYFTTPLVWSAIKKKK